MHQIIKIKEFFLNYDLTQHYDRLRAFVVLALGIWPAIFKFLDKYQLNEEHLVFGITGQGAILLYKALKSRSKGKKSPIDLIILITHLCLGGFFSLILTSGLMQMFKVIDPYKILWIAICIGAFYEMILSTIIDVAAEGAKLFKERAKKSITVFFNLDKKDE